MGKVLIFDQSKRLTPDQRREKLCSNCKFFTNIAPNSHNKDDPIYQKCRAKTYPFKKDSDGELRFWNGKRFLYDGQSPYLECREVNTEGRHRCRKFCPKSDVIDFRKILAETYAKTKPAELKLATNPER